jgi:hypothetical protein
MTRKEEIIAMIKKTVANHLNGLQYKLFIFGSQSNRSELIKADIDVGIEAERKLDGTEESLIWNDLQELPSLYDFDFIDFNKADKNFKKIALKNIEVL